MSIKLLNQDNYFLDNISKDNLKSIGFKYKRQYCTEDCEIYMYNFPVYMYNNTPTLMCNLVLEINSNNIIINVTHVATQTPYSPFYFNGCGNYDTILAQINKKILDEFKKLGIKKKRGS